MKVSPDNRFLVFARSSVTRPAEIYRAALSGPASPAGGGDAVAQLTHVNDAFMEQFELNPAEALTRARAEGTQVSG